MTIHHATLKRADKTGITLIEVDTDEGTRVQAQWEKHRLSRKRAPEALDTMLVLRTMLLEYPALSVECTDDEFTVSVNGEEVYSTDEVPDLADILDACAEKDIDPEDGAVEEENEEKPAQVVLDKYKAKWAEEGHRDHCGDWLALFLDGKFDLVKDGSIAFDADAFATFLEGNGVDMSGKWASLPESGARGWQGRYRMNGRQKLECVVAARGYVVYNGKQYKVPQDEMERLWQRHPSAKEELSTS